MKSLLVLASILIVTGAATQAQAQEKETVAVIGTGDLGNSVGPKLGTAGYRVIYGSRNPSRDYVSDLVTASGPGAAAMTQKAAAQVADIVVLAVPWPPMKSLASNLGNLDGKIVIDATFPVQQADDGYMESMIEPSGAEYIQAQNPGAMVIKSEFTSGYAIDNPLVSGHRPSAFVAGDNREAKEIAARLIADLGLIPVDAGPLRFAREIEGLVRLWYTPLLQRREAGWDFVVSKDTFWTCNWQEDWHDPVVDADNLASMPSFDVPLQPCETQPPIH